jgi:hypothetical protein
MKVMRKEELLWLYELGERNFSQKNLRGKSFRGEDLSEADFSGSDIRGADFSNAILKGANFTNVIAGLQKREALILLSVLMVLSAGLGVLAGLVSTLVELNFSTSPLEETASQWVTFLMVLSFSLVSLSRGIAVGFSVFVGAFFIAGAAALLSSAAVPVAGDIAATITVDSLVAATTAAVGTLMVAAILAFRASTATIAAVGVTAIFALGFVIAVELSEVFASADVNTSAVAVASAVMLLSMYIGWRTAKGDRRYSLTWSVANALTARWGTSFRGADLTKVNFSQAVLKSTDFRGAVLTSTRWDGTKGVSDLLTR